MPTYGYRCTVCSHEFERVQKMSDAPIKNCEQCDALVKRIIYPVGITFKGEGFYINDSNKSNTEKAKPADAAKPAEATPAETVKPADANKPAETVTATPTPAKSP
jgi:putative FmdB family regulatory protein